MRKDERRRLRDQELLVGHSTSVYWLQFSTDTGSCSDPDTRGALIDADVCFYLSVCLSPARYMALSDHMT